MILRWVHVIYHDFAVGKCNLSYFSVGKDLIKQQITGYQRSPDGKVREEKEPITPALFYRRYISTPRPVVMRGYLKDSPVIDAWSDDAELKQK